jgi:hypothetical protein
MKLYMIVNISSIRSIRPERQGSVLLENSQQRRICLAETVLGKAKFFTRAVTIAG